MKGRNKSHEASLCYPTCWLRIGRNVLLHQRGRGAGCMRAVGGVWGSLCGRPKAGVSVHHSNERCLSDNQYLSLNIYIFNNVYPSPPHTGCISVLNAENVLSPTSMLWVDFRSCKRLPRLNHPSWIYTKVLTLIVHWTKFTSLTSGGKLPSFYSWLSFSAPPTVIYVSKHYPELHRKVWVLLDAMAILHSFVERCPFAFCAMLQCSSWRSFMAITLLQHKQFTGSLSNFSKQDLFSGQITKRKACYTVRGRLPTAPHRDKEPRNYVAALSVF